MHERAARSLIGSEEEGMEPQDCTWCGSARSIEYGVCQVCLMRFPEDRSGDRIIVAIDPGAFEVEEGSSAEREAAAGD